MSTSQQLNLAGALLLTAGLVIVLLVVALIEAWQQRRRYQKAWLKEPRINECPYELNPVSRFIVSFIFTRIIH